jgi:hypothetical protein
MMTPGRSAPSRVAALFLALVFAAGAPALADSVPQMTVKIFNDDPDQWVYPVLTTGKGPQDIWLQAFFKVPANQVPNNLYPRGKNAEYLRVKQEFDKLNYGTATDPKYVFNPWVVLIHGSSYVNAPNVYAYSVDDAVGNIQADGLGFIVDVGSTEHLENQLPATPPVTINYAIQGPPPVAFTHFRICQNDAAHDRAVNPFFASFIINANNPANCPVFFFDNKPTPQLYTFTVAEPPPFTFFADQSKASWSPQTAKVIACSGNNAAAPSSQTWCCDQSAGNGVFAFSTPEPHNAHNILNHYVIAHGPEPQGSTPDKACNAGQ